MFDLGANLKSLRKSKGWTQKRLAELLDVSEASISKYESNIATPPIDTLRSCAKLFKISLDEMLGNQQNNQMSLSGLTDEQISVLQQLADTFRNCSFSSEELSQNDPYNVIGKIAEQIFLSR
ncbi:MAG: helix-turn-helix transcriptional regulator [Ruminococcus sp.]|nr:helix-turn-helix transcriptional regulator [Ruminococcus sp.]